MSSAYVITNKVPQCTGALCWATGVLECCGIRSGPLFTAARNDRDEAMAGSPKAGAKLPWQPSKPSCDTCHVSLIYNKDCLPRHHHQRRLSKLPATKNPETTFSPRFSLPAILDEPNGILVTKRLDDSHQSLCMAQLSSSAMVDCT